MTLENIPPLYLQIAQQIERDIQSGRLGIGSRLPPARILAKQQKVSIGTLRKALAALATRGWIRRRQGSGNYVNARPDPENRFAFFRIELIGGTGTPTAEVIDLELITGAAAIPSFDQIHRAHRLRRQRYLDGVPAVVEEIWLDAEMVPEFDPEAFDGALYHYYQSELGISITRAEDSVSLGKPPRWSPPAFHLPAGKNCGYVERRAWSQAGVQVEFSRSWFDPTKAHYVSRQW